MGGRTYAKTIQDQVVYGCTPPEAPDCTEEIALPLTKKTLESVEECISFCLGQTVHENGLEDFYFNWLPDMQCTCLRTVYKGVHTVIFFWYDRPRVGGPTCRTPPGGHYNKIKKLGLYGFFVAQPFFCWPKKIFVDVRYHIEN